MAIEVNGTFKAGAPVDPSKVRVLIVCDAGKTARMPGCAKSTRIDVPIEGVGVDVTLPGGAPAAPDGWEAVEDPFKRRSRFTGGTMRLHSCPACVARERRQNTAAAA